MSPAAIPCRMCQAAPGAPCTYKGSIIVGALGGHVPRTPRTHRRFHYKRVTDAQLVKIVLREARRS